VNCAVNTLESGKDQRPHRHNGVAVTLCIRGQGVYSQIDDQRVDWIDCGVQITPPAALHSHHNRGPERMECLIFQDEALHYYTRTPGFSWT
jgi:gentisate 1,2-dioxygenase